MEHYSCYETAKKLGVTRPCISYRAKNGLIDGAFIDEKTGKYRIPSSYVKEIITKEDEEEGCGEYLTAREVSDAIFISTNALYRRIWLGQVRGAKKVSFRWRIPVEYVDQVMGHE